MTHHLGFYEPLPHHIRVQWTNDPSAKQREYENACKVIFTHLEIWIQITLSLIRPTEKTKTTEASHIFTFFVLILKKKVQASQSPKNVLQGVGKVQA